jgi:hypothetical protein
MELPAGIINPTTPTAFLPAENAYQLEISRYMFVATLAVRLKSKTFSKQSNDCHAGLSSGLDKLFARGTTTL